ncbi:MAG: exodeoxyribonuclease V subunit gamma [Ruminococcus sp.]|nr:exodeoxyribonuclease V subunit gamma [Ruminococcus sp.]
MVEFIIGSSGTGKTTEMIERIKSFSEQGKEQIVLVPEQYSTEFDKKLYFSIGAKAFNRLLSLSFSSLARQLFQIYGEPERKGEYADEMARLIVIYQAVEAAAASPGQLPFFGKRCRQSGFSEEILELVSDMKRSGLKPLELTQKAELMEPRLRDKTRDVAEIYYEYEAIMESYGFKDNLENIREAAKIANLHRYFQGKSVYLDEFESFTADQMDMMKCIFSAAENVTITLRTDDVNGERFTLFETVNATYQTLSRICREMNIPVKLTKMTESRRFVHEDLMYLSRRIMRNLTNEPENAPDAEHIRVFEARDMYNEAEFVCAEIKRLIHRDKSLRYKDIAVISNDISVYGEVLKAAFARFDIPYFMSIERPVSHTAVMAYFTALLELLTARRFKSEQIFRLLKCGLSGYELTDISCLENYCYRWSIEGRMWESEFTGDGDESEDPEKMRKELIRPLMTLKMKLREENTAVEICGLLYGYLKDNGVEQNLALLMDRLIKEDRDNDAAELKRLWGCLMDILDSVADTLKGEILPFREVADIMRSMIGRIKYSLPPQTIDAVTAASARTARLSAPKIIFVMGASEGDLPNQVNVHGIFSEGEKQKLMPLGIDISRPLTDLIASERLIVYKALSTASERLYLTYPLSDLSGNAKYRAQVIEEIREMFGKEYFDREMLVTESRLGTDFYAVTYHAAYYHYMQDRAENTTAAASVGKALFSDPKYKRRIQAAENRRNGAVEYRIDRAIMERLKSFEPFYISATAAESYNKCHFMYFCERVLRLQMPEKIQLDNRIAGDLSHSCFYSLIGNNRKSDFISMSYEDITREIDKQAEKYRSENLGGDFAKTPRFELTFNKIKERITAAFLHTQQALMVSDFVPDRFEFTPRKSAGVVIDFAGGKQLLFSGFVDRSDVCTVNDKKYLRIVDYKSSPKAINEKTLAAGVNLQMLLYLFACTEKGAVYEGYAPAGVLYSPMMIKKLELEASKDSSFNSSAVDSSLKTSGLLIDNITVLKAMEHDGKGRFIPAKINSTDGCISKNSSVIAENSMDGLRNFVYGSLADTAESIYSGNMEAVPLIQGNSLPCEYCRYGNICGNEKGNICRDVDADKIKEAAALLGKKADEE